MERGGQDANADAGAVLEPRNIGERTSQTQQAGASNYYSFTVTSMPVAIGCPSFIASTNGDGARSQPRRSTPPTTALPSSSSAVEAFASFARLTNRLVAGCCTVAAATTRWC
uniref:Uncharacterized protein n=1 Tax=Plectus sambesii TaxID=2011161 RepID=A0A914WG82_9BILA